jgi:hypothetical protein
VTTKPEPTGCHRHETNPVLECSHCRRDGQGWLRAAKRRYQARAAEQRAMQASREGGKP